MVRITIDDELQKKLLHGDEVVELIDASGRLLARVLPQASPPPGIPEDWEEITPPLTEEEYKRALEYNGPGVTTEELLRRLRSR